MSGSESRATRLLYGKSLGLASHWELETSDLHLYREQKLVADLLSKFKDIVDLTPNKEGIEDSPAQRLSAAEQVYEIELRTTELIKAAEDLLSLTRELKEMWSQGPIRKLNEGEEEGDLESDAKAVGSMIEQIMSKQQQDIKLSKENRLDRNS